MPARNDPRHPLNQPTPKPRPLGDAAYPTAKYRADSTQPNGYQVRVCESKADEKAFDPTLWKDSPADLGL